MKWTFYILLGLFVAISITSCTKNLDNYGPQQPLINETPASADRLIVVNEGNFMFGNGSLTVLDLKTDEIVQKPFENINGVPLGDVPQSMLSYDDKSFIVVNNSGKIEMVKREDFSSLTTITGFTSPRYLTVVKEKPLTGWVTDLYANKIWIVDLEVGQITGEIPNNGWGDYIFAHQESVWLMNKTDSVIQVFDKSTMDNIQTIDAGKKWCEFRFISPFEVIAMAKDGIYRMDPNNIGTPELIGGIPSSFPTPVKMAIDSVFQKVYFIAGDVYQMDLMNGLISKIASSSSTRNWYGLAVHPITGALSLANAQDYVQQGEVVNYSIDFSDSTVITTGVNPQFLFFD